MSIVGHLEKHLGPIAEGWKPSGLPSRISVARFHDQPEKGVETFVTLGLSDKVLTMSSGRLIRQELLVSLHERFPANQVATFLTPIAEYVQASGRALHRGECVGPNTPLIPGVKANGVYFTAPSMFDDHFAVFEASEPPTVLVWTLPIVGAEPEFIRIRGWEAFEDQLEASDVADVWDLNRLSIVPD
jgi:hypothetical protein